MQDFPWLIYGAYGFTGKLIAHQAVARGHRPTLAGRDPDKLLPLAKALGLPHLVVDLTDTNALHEALAPFRLVVHAAGPFSRTSSPMVAACLASRTHYFDITGELGVFSTIYGLNDAAQSAGIALIPGMGFDIVPTDCLAFHVMAQLPEVARLEVGIHALGHISKGTAVTMLEHLHTGSAHRAKGRLQKGPLAKFQLNVPFADKTRLAVSAPLADIAAAPRHHPVPEVVAYLALPLKSIRQIQRFGPFMQLLFRSKALRRLGQRMAAGHFKGPDEAHQENARSQAWARATGPNGQTAEATLTSLEPYRLTALCCVLGVEAMAQNPERNGALTPAQAFGPDFILQIPNTTRNDRPTANEHGA